MWKQVALVQLFPKVRAVKTAVVAIAVIALFLRIPVTTHAQATAIYTVGTSTPPTLDGKWEAGEWDNGVELAVAYSLGGPLQPAYLRLMHDTAWLYFIYDVTFDTTQVSEKTPQDPVIVLVLDGTAQPFSPYNLNDCQLTAEVRTNGEMSIGYGGSNETNYHPYLTQYLRQVNVTQSMGPSPHSSTPHRIWEGRIPLEPLIVNAPKAADFSPVIGFNTEVQDALGNAEQLQPLTQTYSIVYLKIAAYPVPENVNLITPFLLAIAVLAIYAHKRNRNPTQRIRLIHR